MLSILSFTDKDKNRATLSEYDDIINALICFIRFAVGAMGFKGPLYLGHSKYRRKPSLSLFRSSIASSTSASNPRYFYTNAVLILKTIVVLQLLKENLYLEPRYIGDSAFYFTNTYSRITASGLSLEVEFQEPYNLRLGKKIFFHNVQQNHTCVYKI